MNVQGNKRVGSSYAIVISTCALLFINIIGLKNRLLFHFLIETIAIILCSCLFIVIWILRKKIENGYYKILGIGLLFSSFFDLMHILTFTGMPIFPNLGVNHSIYFFLAGRFFQAVSFLIAPICIGKKTKSDLTLLLYSISTVIVTFVIVHYPLPPLLSLAGSHTLTRILIDSSIIAVLILALFFVYKKKEALEIEVFWIILGSTILAILSETIISLNTNETHLVSVLGLNLRIVAYFLLFQITIITGITKPQQVFYHELQTSREQLQNLFNNLNEGICILDQHEKFIFSNPAADLIFLDGKGRLSGQDLSKFVSSEELQKITGETNNSSKNSSHSFELEITDSNHQKKSLMLFSSPRVVEGNIDGEFIIFHDISEMKENRSRLEEAGHLYQSLFMDAPIRIWENDYSEIKKAIDELKDQGVTDYKDYFEKNPQFVKRMVQLAKVRTYNKLVEETYVQGNPTRKISSLTQIFWKESYKTYISELMAIATNQTRATYEMTTITPDNQIIYSIINLSVVSGENPDYSRVIISADDITEREKARLELQSSEEKFRLLAENSGVGISYFDLQGNILYHNEKLMEQIGKPFEDEIGKHISDLYDKEIAERTLERIRRVSRSNETPTFVDYLDLPDGRKWYSMTYTRIMEDEDHCIGVQIISHDITQQKEMESQLESLARFPRENPNPVMRLTKDGIVTYSNEGGYPILKVWNYEEKGKIPDYMKAIIQNCLNFGKPEIIEEKVNDNIVSLYMAPITDMNYVNIYGRDVTDLKNAEDKLLEYSKNLEKIVAEQTDELLLTQERLARQEKLAVMGQLASGVGHELRNPLAVINNAVYMLRLGATRQLSEPSDDYLDIIDQEVASANKIITDLLTFARIKPANLISTDIHECLEELFKKFVPPENVNVKIDLPQNLPKVYVDDKQIDQVMANLIINAYQAIPNKGSLTITAMIEKNMLRLDFTDTGIGIPPENLEKIFEPLFSTKTKGIGLGLTISKMLIEANGGKIKVRSTLNKGTIFSLYLPREQPSK